MADANVVLFLDLDYSFEARERLSLSTASSAKS
jgi:hypothetical protein